MKNAKFTARNFDKATFESKHRKGRSYNSDSKKNAQQESQAHRIQLAPFNLSTETRGRQKTKKQLEDQTNEEEIQNLTNNDISDEIELNEQVRTDEQI